jgi:hypothetical protein
MPEIAPREWRWLVAMSAVVLVVLSIPYLVGWLSATPQAHFSGFIFGLEDMYSYLAKMRFGARDGWEFRLVYTSEPHSGGLVFLPFLALGKLTALISGRGAAVSTSSLLLSFHVARLVCGALLLVTVYHFIAEFVSRIGLRRLAWAIAVIGGGLGWLEVMLTGPIVAGRLPPVEFYVPEAFTMLILSGLPHLALGRSLLLIGWLALFKATDRHAWRLAVGAGLAWLGMGLCVPFYTGLLGILVATWLSGLWIMTRHIPLEVAALAAIAGILPAAYFAYNAWLFSSNPVFAVWASQNLLPSPPPFEYMVAFGVLIALAVPGVLWLLKNGINRRSVLLLAWPPSAAMMVYLPINVQRRLLEGVIVPLGILAAMGVIYLFETRSGGRLWTRVAAITLLAALVPSMLFLVVGEAAVVSQPGSTLFRSSDELTALQWLADHAPADSVVLSTRPPGMLLPAYAPVRVYVGHGPETIHSQAKTLEAIHFFGDGLIDDQRLKLLHANDIRFVWIGPEENALACQTQGCFDPQRLGLTEVFRSGAVRIEEVGP